jgi:hypothetical protein
MKYLKTYENINPDLHELLCNFLDKMKTDEFTVSRYYRERGKNGYSIALGFINKTFKSSYALFTLRVSQVNDKQLRNKLIKNKIKISLDNHKILNWQNSIPNKEYILNLIDFITDTFKKYSYFNKIDTYKNDFYINTSDIQKIMNVLNNDFDLYVSTKKYNL